ncbi:hypothetical protein ACJMK2_032452 [Sinanodonta woodiana]|uniref:Retinol dehydrogenase 12 n=1 Tax=Sinanodonta woodiana TaxID=1069815 RepID=A0ABD3X1R2_SINWO
MLHSFLCILWIFWCWLKVYLCGTIFLLRQLMQRHRKLTDVPLQTGKVAIVTGGASGIGFFVSKGLVAKNVHVIIGARDSNEGKLAIDKIREDYPNAKVDYIHLDLASLESVESFSQEFLSRNLPLHILVNNAGVMFCPLRHTVDGFEEQFQVNFLSHFLLTQLLLPKLKECGEDNSWARIVFTSSITHFLGHIDLRCFGKRIEDVYDYSPHQAYCDAKLAMILACYHQARVFRTEKAKVAINVLHPGIVDTRLIHHVGQPLRWLLGFLAKFLYKTPQQGAEITLYVALSPEIEGMSGRYYDNSQEQLSASQSYDTELQENVWTTSCQILKPK